MTYTCWLEMSLQAQGALDPHPSCLQGPCLWVLPFPYHQPVLASWSERSDRESVSSPSPLLLPTRKERDRDRERSW